jgi:hypothetical protein
MNKQGTKRGNTIIFVSFDLGEDSKLNITYLKLWWNNIYNNTICISKHYYIKYQVIICRFILELCINFNVPQNTGKLIKILIICGIYIILICLVFDLLFIPCYHILCINMLVFVYNFTPRLITHIRDVSCKKPIIVRLVQVTSGISGVVCL